MNLHVDSNTRAKGAPASAGLVALRNTYGLLACSLLLAVPGAWFGVNLRVTEGVTGTIALIVLLLGGFGFSMLIRRAWHTRAALPVLGAFTFLAGLMLSLTLVRWLGFYNTGNALMIAFASASAVLFAAAAATSVFGRAPAPSIELVLGVVMLALVAAVAEQLLRSSTQVIALSILVGGLLGAAVLHERRRLARDEVLLSPAAQTVGVYLGLFTAFRSLSVLLGRTGGERT